MADRARILLDLSGPARVEPDERVIFNGRIEAWVDGARVYACRLRDADEGEVDETMRELTGKLRELGVTGRMTGEA